LFNFHIKDSNVVIHLISIC